MAQLPHFTLQTVTPPAVEAVSLDEAKLWLRVDGADYDDLITGLIGTARELVEGETGRGTVLATYRMCLDRFPLLPNSQYAPGFPASVQPVVNNTWPFDPSAWAIVLPRTPLVSLVSVSYYDPNGTLQTMSPSDYVVDLDSEPPRLTTSTASYWPACQYRTGSVRVTFNAGYATPAAVPNGLKTAMKLLVSHWFANDSAVDAGSMASLPMAAQSLMQLNAVPWVW